MSKPLIKNYYQREKTRSIMRPLYFAIMFGAICLLLMCAPAHGQTSQKQIDSVNKLKAEYIRFSDSLYANTTVKQLREYLYKKITTEFYVEGKFDEQWVYYLNDQYSIWVQKKQKK